METLQTIWGWQPALYLFLGGMGAAAFLVAGALHFYDKTGSRKTICASMGAAVICLAVGLLLLLSELITPIRGMMMWQSFSNFTSWMTFGAWAVFAAVCVFALCFLALSDTVRTLIASKRNSNRADELDTGNDQAQQKAKRGLDCLIAIGMALAFAVMAYTGVLLMAVPDVPLWNTPALPCLFVASALDTGIALVEVIGLALSAKGYGPSEKASAILEKSVVAVVIAEAAIAAVFVLIMTSGNASTAGSSESFKAVAIASVTMLLSGELAPYFWTIFVAMGLFVPLVAAIAAMRCTKSNAGALPKAITGIGATCAMAGGCALRFLILAAGTHADFIADAINLINL